MVMYIFSDPASTRESLLAKLAYRRDVLRRMENMRAPKPIIEFQRGLVNRIAKMLAEITQKTTRNHSEN